MINVLVPMAGSSQMFPESEFPYPTPLIEVGRTSIIELVIRNLQTVADEAQFIFVISQADCRKYYLDSTINILTHQRGKIVRLDAPTQGAACSALMAISHINNDESLVIANPDQIFDDPLSLLIEALGDADAGVPTFDSVHPRWSYVRVDSTGQVQETAEKRPISRNAIAGFYYFKKGRYFVRAAMAMIRKGASVNGSFFIAPTLNELVLEGKLIRAVPIDAARYHSFYTPQRIREYEGLLLGDAAQVGVAK